MMHTLFETPLFIFLLVFAPVLLLSKLRPPSLNHLHRLMSVCAAFGCHLASISFLNSALALDFKITVAPVVWLLSMLYCRHGRRALIAESFATAACAASPFVLPRHPLANYVAWLLLSEHQGLVGSLFVKNLAAAAFLFGIPGIATAGVAKPEWRFLGKTLAELEGARSF